jgi:hypothetical protein
MVTAVTSSSRSTTVGFPVVQPDKIARTGNENAVKRCEIRIDINMMPVFLFVDFFGRNVRRLRILSPFSRSRFVIICQEFLLYISKLTTTPNKDNSLRAQFPITLRNFAIAQFAIITTVIALGAFAYVVTSMTSLRVVGEVMRLLDVGVEQSLPTYVSVVNLILASILAFIIYIHERAKANSDAMYWLFLSLLFLFLSFDEFAGIHEKFAHLYEVLVRKEIISRQLSTHQWLPFSLLFISVVAIILFPFLRKLPKDTLRYFIIAGFVFVAGAVGFEYLGAVMLETGIAHSRKDAVYLARRLFEEGFEMYGVAIFNWALYREILRRQIFVVVTA